MLTYILHVWTSLLNMSWPMKIAFGCHLVATLLIGAFGLTYFFKTKFMSYHAAAVGMDWSKVPGKFPVLILALMKAVGGAALAVSVLELFLLCEPFMKSEKWALVAIPVGGIVASLGALCATVYLLRKAPATKKPPWYAAVLCILLFATGLVLSLL